jgi:hypothetical protein
MPKALEFGFARKRIPTLAVTDIAHNSIHCRHDAPLGSGELL